MLTYVEIIAFFVLFYIIATINCRQRARTYTRPPWLSETIPYVSNTWQFITNKSQFMDRVREALRSSPIVVCRLGPIKIHYVKGDSNVSIIFRSSFTSEPWINRIQKYAAGYTSFDLLKFAADKSGGAVLPRQITEASQSPLPKRIWHAMHRMNEDGLLSPYSVTTFTRTYQVFLNDHISSFPVKEWVDDVQLFTFLKRGMAVAATRSMLGNRIMDLFPNLVDAFWDWEQYVETLSFGIDVWVNKHAVAARDRFSGMCFKWYAIARQEYELDTSGDIQEVREWDPILGSRMSRGHVRWMKEFEFSDQTIGGILALFSYGLHTNTIPISTWMLMEIIKDQDLLRAIKEEIDQAKMEGSTCSEFFDYPRLASLPLLQSVYTETLRLHVRVLITRTSIEPIKVAGYELPEGSIVQAPTTVTHLDNEIWGTPEHPASEFWAYRHVQLKEISNPTSRIGKRLEFSMKGRSASYFPYGGGFYLCTGRKYAKCEILTSIAMIISRFDIEFVEWVNPNGSKSLRPAIASTSSASASHPDRDMKIRWRRLW